MSADTVGSIRGFTVEGTPFRASADANFNRKPTKVENKAIPTSGKAMIQKTIIVPVLEGVTLNVNANEMAALKSFSEGLPLVKVAYTTAAGDRYRCIGQIQIDGHDSEEGKAAITVLPEDDWTLFPRTS